MVRLSANENPDVDLDAARELYSDTMKLAQRIVDAAE